MNVCTVMGRKKYNTDEERRAAKNARNAVYMAKYYSKNKEELAVKMAEHYKKNRDEILAKRAAYRAAHKEEIAAKEAEYRSTPYGRAKYLVCGYRKKDKKYNRGDCTVTPQWVVDNVFSGQCCVYCGESDWTKLGVDRKDSSLPHTPENCVPCCKACNDKKRAISYDDFMRRIGKIA